MRVVGRGRRTSGPRWVLMCSVVVTVAGCAAPPHVFEGTPPPSESDARAGLLPIPEVSPPGPLVPPRGHGVYGAVFFKPTCDGCGTGAAFYPGIVVSARSLVDPTRVKISTTNTFGRFAIVLPSGRYRLSVHGGKDCAEYVVRVRKASYSRVLVSCNF